MTTDAYTNGISFQSILLGATLRPNWYDNNDLSLPSRATDLANPYSASGVVGSGNYSGYNSPVGCLFIIRFVFCTISIFVVMMFSFYFETCVYFEVIRILILIL
jgi:hypothetical protein